MRLDDLLVGDWPPTRRRCARATLSALWPSAGLPIASDSRSCPGLHRLEVVAPASNAVATGEQPARLGADRRGGAPSIRPASSAR